MISSVINKIDLNQNTLLNELNDQFNFLSISFPDELIYKILRELPPFGCLALSTVSKKFNTFLDDDLFWKEKLGNIMKYDSSLGLPMKSQFLIKAMNELSMFDSREINSDGEMKTKQRTLKSFLRGNEFEPCFLNQPEMLTKALKYSFSSEENLTEIFRYVDKELLNDEKFILSILPGSIRVLNYASKVISEDSRFRNLQFLIHINENTTCKSVLQKSLKRANPIQRKLFIKQITQNILENSITTK
ncbi:MAG: F-box protein [Parachlamydiaceae bacterium]|nr:F-box protein [Parachlamydiaceae bacterium]